MAFGPAYGVLVSLANLTSAVLVAACVPADAIILGPRDVIRRDFVASALSVAAVGLMSGLLFTKLYNPVLGLAFGLANGLGWLVASASVRYAVAVALTMRWHPVRRVPRLGPLVRQSHRWICPLVVAG